MTEIEHTTERGLNRYALEQLLLTKAKTKLLMLVAVDDDETLFGGLGAKINKQQDLGLASISGRSYYRLKCTIVDSNRDQLLYGVTAGMYSEKQFKTGFGNREGGFVLQFDDAEKPRHFNWRDAIDFPSSFMFFGTLLSQTRSYDSIFHSAKSLSTIYHRFKHYYLEVEGDVTASLALYNAYLHGKAIILSKLIKKKEKEAKNYDGNIFNTKKVTEYLELIE